MYQIDHNAYIILNNNLYDEMNKQRVETRVNGSTVNFAQLQRDNITVLKIGESVLDGAFRMNMLGRLHENKPIVLVHEAIPGIGDMISESLSHFSKGRVEHLNGSDGIIEAKKANGLDRVSLPIKIHTDWIIKLLKEGTIPVITPSGFIGEEICNVNPDIAAAHIAVALGARNAVFFIEIPGINTENEHKLLDHGLISIEAIPKVEGAIYTAKKGVRTIIANGDKYRLSEILSGSAPFTEILR